MLVLRDIEKQLLSPHIFENAVVADFTMGNGNDTLWLAQQVGKGGKVYAFDIQEDALLHTAEKLAAEGLEKQCVLIKDSHHKAADYISEQLDAGIFNLGFLPGGDKRITTLRETTLPAVKAAISLIKAGGGLLIAVYPGHEEGYLEGQMLTELFESYDQKMLSAYKFNVLNSKESPFFILVEKNPRYKG